MEELARLAGFFAARGVWNVSDGAALVPFAGYASPDGSRHVMLFASGPVESAIAEGKGWLASNPRDASQAALVYDGYLVLEQRQVDALLVEARAFGAAPVSFVMAVPYRSAEHPGGFAVYRPRCLAFSGPAEAKEALGAAFMRGVQEHEQGARVWNAHSDDSVL